MCITNSILVSRSASPRRDLEMVDVGSKFANRCKIWESPKFRNFEIRCNPSSTGPPRLVYTATANLLMTLVSDGKRGHCKPKHEQVPWAFHAFQMVSSECVVINQEEQKQAPACSKESTATCDDNKVSTAKQRRCKKTNQNLTKENSQDAF